MNITKEKLTKLAEDHKMMIQEVDEPDTETVDQEVNSDDTEPKSKGLTKLASYFFHSRTQTHVFHLRLKGAGSYAAHKALQGYYKEIVGLVDGLVESHQGKYGLIEFEDVTSIDNNASIDNIINYFEKLATDLEEMRTDKSLQDSWMQNQIDNVAELIYSTKYKLVNLL
jgi:DNA-binding ferritin-like protein